MGQSVLQIILKVTKEGTGDKEAAKNAKELKGTLQDLGLGSIASASGLALVVGGMTAVATFTKAAVDETVKYADEVRSMMQLSGQSAEESSRLLQVMDDLKVESGALTTATKTLAKEGLTMNIETLAKLSDEYNRLNNGADKAAFLVKNFGKNGLGMAEAMEQGGAALRGMNEAVEESLVLDQKAVDDARDYQRQLDGLNDSWMALKVTIGREAVPVLNDVLGAINNNIKKGFEWSDLLRFNPIGGFVMGLNDLKASHAELNPEIDSATQSYIAMGNAITSNAPSAQALIEQQKEAAEAAKELSNTYNNIIGDINGIQQADANYTSSMEELAGQRKQVESDLATARAQGWSESSQKVQDYKNKLADLDGKVQDTAAKHKEASDKMILDNVLQALSVGGLETAEFERYQEIGVAMGIFTQKQADEAIAMDTLAKRVADGTLSVEDFKRALELLPSGITIDVLLNTVIRDPYHEQGSYGGGYANGTDGWEMVPPGFPKDSYPVMVSSGEKFAVIPAGGGGNSQLAGGGNMTLNLTYAPGVSMYDQAAITEFVYTGIRKAKADGLL